MPGKANRSLAASVDDTDGLIFSWARRCPGVFWLWGFLVLSLLLHATGFYLFQVVYPSSGRLEPFPARVLILDKKNAANAVLLQELNDRLVFLQSASAGSESRKGIDDFSVSFRPSFADRTPPFRKPVASEATPKPSEAISLPATPSALPPAIAGKSAQPTSPEAASATSPPEEKPAIRRRWSLAGDLSQRAISVIQAENFDKALPSIGKGPEVVLDIVIGASGEVEQVIVKSGKQHPAANGFVDAVKKQLKFDPVPGNSFTKGEITIHQ